jgi:hypothetical protein
MGVTGRWHCYAIAAINQDTGGSGPAFNLGIYDPSISGNAVSKAITIQSGAGDGNYDTYDLGVVQLNPNDVFWITAPGGSASDVYFSEVILTSAY